MTGIPPLSNSCATFELAPREELLSSAMSMETPRRRARIIACAKSWRVQVNIATLIVFFAQKEATFRHNYYDQVALILKELSNEPNIIAQLSILVSGFVANTLLICVKLLI